MFTRLLALGGMRVLATDLLDTRLKLARESGATRAVRGDDTSLATEADRLTHGPGLDAVVVAVPVDSIVNRRPPAQTFASA